MTWPQNYNPVGGIFLSAGLAAIPVFLLLGLLGIFHVKAHIATLIALATSLVLAVVVYKMPPALAVLAAGNGALFGLFPIGWIVLNAIFVYDITIKTGKFSILRQGIASLTRDKRIQVILIAFSFGALIEGCAGFGTPVAISAAMLIGLGIKPLPAAGLALIGNTAPVAFGALGSPLITLAKVTDLDLHLLSSMTGRQLPFFSLLIPFWLIIVFVGWRKTMEVWPACLVAGLSFAISQFLVSNFHGPWLVDIVAAIVSLFSLAVLLRFWQPRTVWIGDNTGGEPEASVAHSRRDYFIAWLPWILLSVFVFIWGIPQIKVLLDKVSAVEFVVPMLDRAVLRVPPAVMAEHAERAVFNFNWLSAAGTGLLFSAILSGLLLGEKPAALARLYLQTLHRLRIPLITISGMLAFGFVSRYSGADTTLGLLFAKTGPLFPFFSPLIGWLGVALTGSDTSSNVLFGNLQKVSAMQLGLSPILTAAANSSGGVMGKMIDAQSIVVASAATKTEDESQNPHAGDILRFVFLHSLVLAILVGVVVALQAYVFPWMIPVAP